MRRTYRMHRINHGRVCGSVLRGAQCGIDICSVYTWLCGMMLGVIISWVFIVSYVVVVMDVVMVILEMNLITLQ